MDFIYGQLPEIVDEMIYTPCNSSTAEIQIDNQNKKIKANVLRVPKDLTVNTKDETFIFNGSADTVINLPKYEIKETTEDAESAIQEWTLFEYSHTNKDFTIPCGTIKVNRNNKVLCIENGDAKGSIQSKAAEKLVGSTSTGIQSFSFGGNDIDKPEVIQLLKLDNFNDSTKPIIIEVIKFKLIDSELNKYAVGLRLKNNSEVFENSSEVFEFELTDTPVQVINGVLFPLSDREIDPFKWTLEIDKLTNTLKARVLMQGAYATNTEIAYSSVSVMCSAEGQQSMSMGQSTRAKADQSQAFGIGTITSWPGQMVVGKYNKEVVSALFIVGNGKDEFNRSNALVVYTDGRVEYGDTTSINSYKDPVVSTQTTQQAEEAVSNVSVKVKA